MLAVGGSLLRSCRAGGAAVAHQRVEEGILDALADAFFAAPGMPTPSALGAGRYARVFVAQLPAEAQWQLGGLLRLIEWGGLLFTGRRFTLLDLDRRREVLSRLATSSVQPMRLAVVALKQVCAMGTFRHPATWTVLGYDGPSLQRMPPPWARGP